MNTVNKVKVRNDILEGLRMELLENSLDKAECRIYKTTKNEDLSNSITHDRVFNSVELIEELLVDKMDIPNDSVNAEITAKVFKPIKTYDNKIKYIRYYNDKIKG